MENGKGETIKMIMMMTILSQVGIMYNELLWSEKILQWKVFELWRQLTKFNLMITSERLIFIL